MKFFTKISFLLFIITLLGFFSFVSVNSIQAAPSVDRTASVSGNWNDTATWGGLSVPTSVQNVEILSGVTVNVTAEAEAASIIMYNNAANSTINIGNGVTLTISETVALQPVGFEAVLNIGDGNLILNNLNVNAAFGTPEVVIDSGSITASSSLNFLGGQLVSTGDSIINIGGNLSDTADLETSGTGTINFNGAGAQTIGNYATYNNVTFSGSGTKSFTGNSTINGVLTIESGVVADLVLTTPTAQNLYFDDAFQVAGTWGATGSGADNINDTYFTGAGMLTVLELGEDVDVTPPETTIISSDTDSSIATFEFSSNEESSTFECSLDGDDFVLCVSPYTTPVLLSGEHSFEVRAIDASLNVDASPATYTWMLFDISVDPVLILHFDETSGSTAYDSSGNSNDGTITGDENWTSGYINNGFALDGLGNYLTLDRPVENDISICTWLQTTSVGNDVYHWQLATILESEVGGLGNDFGFGVDSNGYLAYGNGGEYDATVNGVTSIIDNEWHHVCATRSTETGEVNLYVDGSLDATGLTSTNTLDANELAAIGFGFDGGAFLGGIIDELYVYDSVLAYDDIVELYGDILPSVESVSPSDGETRVSINENIIITFSEPMDTGSLVISTGPCEEECATYDVEWREDDTVVELSKTNGSFERNTTYTIGIEAENVDGISLEDEYEWSFTTQSISSGSSGSSVSFSRSTTSTNTTTTQAEAPQTPKFTFIKNLKFFMNDIEVKELQKFLNNNGYIVSTVGPGSKGLETSFFGAKTRAALIAFQKANNITPAVGYFGPITRGIINEMIQ